jgi:hypothetical protein
LRDYDWEQKVALYHESLDESQALKGGSSSSTVHLIVGLEVSAEVVGLDGRNCFCGHDLVVTTEVF